MKSHSKLIILYGFAASGKTTIAKKYIDDHPLSITIEGDLIIEMIGQWRKFEDSARELVYKHTCSIVRNHLQSGHTVILPYLLTNATHIESFKAIATEVGCSFYEIYLKEDKEAAISRLLKRGTWGEVDSPLLTDTDTDRPEIKTLFGTMKREMAKRNDVTSCKVTIGDINTTYQSFLELVSQ